MLPPLGRAGPHAQACPAPWEVVEGLTPLPLGTCRQAVQNFRHAREMQTAFPEIAFARVIKPPDQIWGSSVSWSRT